MIAPPLNREQRQAIRSVRRAESDTLRLISELRAEVAPGCCPFCEDPLPPSDGRKPRQICGREWCVQSYGRAWREGAAAATVVDWLHLLKQQAQRFWSKVERTETCWLWRAATDKDGYGKFQITGKPGQQPKQRHVRAHRVAWMLANDQWFPGDLVTMHVCDTPSCVRPDHLRPGTQAENRADCMRKGRGAVGERNGHALHPESYPTGERHPCAKLTDQQIGEVLRLRSEGVSARELGRRFEINENTVRSYINGRSRRTASLRGET